MVRVIVPRRPDGGHRDRLWEFLRPEYEPIGEIVEGHHNTGIWNRAAAINKAGQGNWDIAVILDADTIVPVDQIHATIEHVRETGHVATAFRRMVNLTREETFAALDGRFPPGPFKGNLSCSRCVVVPRKFWEIANGFDEKFVGWAGEDLAFWEVARRTVGIHRQPGDAFHFWHEPDPTGEFNHPCYVANLARVKRYRQADEAELLALARSEI